MTDLTNPVKYTFGSFCNLANFNIGPGLWVISFIYKYETSATYPLYETTQHFVVINK